MHPFRYTRAPEVSRASVVDAQTEPPDEPLRLPRSLGRVASGPIESHRSVRGDVRARGRCAGQGPKRTVAGDREADSRLGDVISEPARRDQRIVEGRAGCESPCGALMPASKIGHPTKGKIVLKVNGQVRQDGDLNQMIWNVPETISKLSEMVALEAGDIIMTGTPSGVAATVAGDKIECEVEGVGKLRVTIGPSLK